MIKEIQAAIVEIIKPHCKSIYFNRCPAIYPRIRAEIKRLKTPPPVLQFMLYLDYYGKTDEAEQLKDIADRVYLALRAAQYENDRLIISIHSEGGEQDEIGDTAADVKHIMAAVPLRVIFKEDI